MDAKTLDLSLLLTTYNRTQDCIVCLNKLNEQYTYELDVEIILLDDWHLKDDILETYCYKKGVRYIHTGSQKNNKIHWRVPGYAYNIGAKVARGDYYIIGGAEMYHLNLDCLYKMYKSSSASAPIVYDEPKLAIKNYKNYNVLNNKLPFCFGLPAKIYHEIGGYDEDFTGYCFDDNDFSDRVLSLLPFKTIDAEVIHLWNPRGAENRGDKRINHKTWQYNKELYEKRKGVIVRNSNREWGKL